MIPIELVDAVLKEGLGDDVPPEERAFWHATHQQNYTGDAGRERVRISTINLRDRDGLHGRLDRRAMPGPADARHRRTRSTPSPTPRMRCQLFVNSADAELRVVDGGRHFLSASDPGDVNPATVEFINRNK